MKQPHNSEPWLPPQFFEDLASYGSAAVLITGGTVMCLSPAEIAPHLWPDIASTCANWKDGRCETCGEPSQDYQVAPTQVCRFYRDRRAA